MILPVVLFVSSVLAMAATWAMPDVFLLAVLCAVASAIVLLRAWRAREKPANWIVVDGSNVMYWNGGVPKLETVITVLDRLRALGFAPGVMFDANAGYLLEGRHRDDAAFARGLGMPTSRVLVMHKGVQADGYILKSARDLGARIVTNDRFRDWASEYPEVSNRGHLVQGGYQSGKLWLDLGH
ncbi:hypothetical protein ACEN2J_05945 [Pseudorhodobacter sp. W20_MBD10_FR17]|uniref:NYN domain-containing protein n=1 Tax=Pseudorhodobacter sp. W20_MBD10_FR17 TaxID=3240266 RepID=UPI003F952CFE